jgi:hypothetical protein
LNKRAVSSFHIEKTYSSRCQQTPQLVPIARYPHCYEKKQQKAWFETEYSKFLDPRKGAKLQWSEDRSKIKEYNHSYLMNKTSRHSRNNIVAVF